MSRYRASKIFIGLIIDMYVLYVPLAVITPRSENLVLDIQINVVVH